MPSMNDPLGMQAARNVQRAREQAAAAGPVQEAVRQAKVGRAWAQIQLAEARERLEAARAGEGDNEDRQGRVERLEERIRRHEEEIARFTRVTQMEGVMTALEEKFNAARSRLQVGLGSTLAQLMMLEGERDKLPADYYQKERMRIVQEARDADREAMAAIEDYQRAAIGAARSLRAAAEASVDPTATLAELAERKSLAESVVDGSVLLDRAHAMLDAGQPARAKLLLGAATDKGASPLGAHQLAAAVEDALDAAVPDRAKAKAVEDSVLSNLNVFRQARLGALSTSGLGIARDGSAGSGRSGEAATADAVGKVLDFIAKRERGEGYIAPVGDGSNHGGDA